MSDHQKGSAGIKEIARALNISIGTVDRALHGRTGVSEKTKAQVLQMADRLGYRPNLAARALKLNRKLSIAAILPKHISHFFDPMRAGIHAAAAAVKDMQVSLDFFEFPRLGVGDMDAIEAATQRHHDGIIFIPGDMRKYDGVIRKFARRGVAMMCVGNDAPNTERFGFVAAHAYISGAVAAELLAMRLSQKATVAVFSGDLHTLDHAEKLRGFAATLAVQAPHLTLLSAQENHERPREAYQQALVLMKRKDRPQGLYLSTANSMPVLRALEELNLLGKVQIIATDLFQELVPLIEFGKVSATLYQRPFTQGKVAFELLVRHLQGEEGINPTVRLAPHVIFRSNLPLFSSSLAKVDELPEEEE
jgi:LacI family transcriptional regulator